MSTLQTRVACNEGSVTLCLAKPLVELLAESNQEVPLVELLAECKPRSLEQSAKILQCNHPTKQQVKIEKSVAASHHTGTRSIKKNDASSGSQQVNGHASGAAKK